MPDSGFVTSSSAMRISDNARLGVALCLLHIGLVEASDPAGDDRVDAYDVDEIVVTTSRRPERALATPFAVNIQDVRELLAVRQVRTTPDAMREIPGVTVQKTGHGQGSPYIRGFTGPRTLFLIDGIRLNNSALREGPNQYWNTVDPLSIQRLELVKGPSSVLYGSDAIGGTVNAISRRFADLKSEESHGRVILRGASAEASLLARAEAGFAIDNVAVFAGGSYKGFGDLRAGGDTGTQPKTGYKERDADIQLTWDIAANRTIRAALQYVDQDDAWRVHRTVYGKSWRGTTTGNEQRRSLDQQRMLAYTQFHAIDLEPLGGGDFALSLSLHQQNEARVRIRSDGRLDVQGIDVSTFGFFGKVDVPTKFGDWTAGIDYYRDYVDSFRKDFNADGSLNSVRIQGPIADDATYTIADAYVQLRKEVSQRAEVIAGFRYAWSRANAKSVESPLTGERISLRDKWNKVTGSLRYTQAIDNEEHVWLFAGISQGFRAPNLSDLTRYDSARSNEIETPAFGLQPENFITYEVGTKFENDRWSGQVSIYHTSIDEMIIRTPTGRIIDGQNEVTKRNSGAGFAGGIELQARYALSDAWTLFGNVTWMDGEVQVYPDSSGALVDEPLDRLMPPHSYLGVRHQPAASSLWLEALISAVSRQDRLSTRDQNDTDRIPAGGTPGYAIVSLRGGRQFSDAWQLSVAVENVLDENYRTHGSGLNEPGRNLVVTLFHIFH